MRRHAKASTAGSNRQKARKLALPAGLFAALVALVVLVGSASAANGVVNFFGGSGSEGGRFSSSALGPGGVDVNQTGTGGATAGDVYVVDRGNNRIQQFTAGGAFVRTFGVDVGGTGVNVCEVAANCAAGTASAEAAGMNEPQGLAIDQATGNVFVTDGNNHRVDIFGADGTFQAAIGWGVDTGAAALELCTTASGCVEGVFGAGAGQLGSAVGYPAVAPAGSPNAGDLYVADRANQRVDQFEPTLTGGKVTGISFVKSWGWGVDTGAPEFQQCTTVSECQSANTSSPTSNPGQFSFNQPVGLAVDSNGNVYTAESEGNNRVQKFNSSGDPVAFSATELTGSPGPLDVAVDPTTDHVFGLKETSEAPEKRVLEFTAGGAFIATHASGTTISSANGLAVVDGTTDFYVTTNNGVSFAPGVFFLGTKVNPVAATQPPAPLTAHAATLRGQVNPEGFTTHYRFELSSDGGLTWTRLPAKEQNEVDLGNGTTNIPVEREVVGLIGSHTYRYRIVATKPFGAGSATSNTTTFTTPASAPQVVATFTTAVTTTTAVLNAQINPNNQASTYHFEYGPAPCSANPCTSIPGADVSIGSGETPVAVANEITGLQPNNTYYYRVVATNATGTTEGPDKLLTTAAQQTPDADCPNQLYRAGPGAFLPDCRAYEMVSPVDKGGSDIAVNCNVACTRTSFHQTSLDGEKLTYTSNTAFGDQPSSEYSNQYIATRGPTGWFTHGINAPQGKTIFDPFFDAFLELEARYDVFTPDLSSGWLRNFNLTPLTPSGQPGLMNLYRRDNLSGAFEAITVNPPLGSTGEQILGTHCCEAAEVQGVSDDGSHAIFAARAALTADAAPGGNRQLYDYTDGAIQLVSVLPDGTPSTLDSNAGLYNPDPFADRRRASYRPNAVSADGTRIFWTATSFSGEGQIYVRIDGETTVQIPQAKARFWNAARDGSKVLYSTGEFSGTGSLYLFDVDSETQTPVAGKLYGVAGASDDLSTVYFVSGEALDGGTLNQPNLYVTHEGTVHFIATLDPEDAGQNNGTVSLVSDAPIRHVSRVTPDGDQIAFQSVASLTGYDNTDAVKDQAAVEVYRYDASSDTLLCVSCNPSGARPVGKVLQKSFRVGDDPSVLWAAAWLPAEENSSYSSNPLSDDGSFVFFNSFDALLPRDTNGAQDVYEWRAQGVGGCQQEKGCLALISTGESPTRSEFVDASHLGDEVFFTTGSSILPQDPGLVDIYVARIDGGFPIVAKATPCIGDACQHVPAAPRDPTPTSATFRGEGDLKPGKRRRCGARKEKSGAASRRAKGKKAHKAGKRCRRGHRQGAGR